MTTVGDALQPTFGSCPDDELLAGFVGRELDEADRAAIEAHVLTCRSCCDALVELAHAFVDDDDARNDDLAPRVLAQGSRVGRYLVLGTLGRGAMGVVYSAYDPDLDRKVAIKLLRPLVRADPERRREREQRLVREARALAAISHPNVMTIHDVGVDDGQVFIAMELFHGRTLRGWLAERARGTDETMAVLLAAGRGLAAAHDAGVVHRDFKPDNVMVDAGATERGESGVPRVVVTDFGLARVELRAREPGLDGHDTLERPGALTRTVAGALVGTPAYMAPEQLRGERADERADQFSFCVVLFEALFGARPYEADDLDALLVAIERAPPECPRGRLDRRREAALQRGLAVDSDARFASVRELLVALEQHRAESSLRWVLGLVGAIVLLVALATFAARGWTESQPCADAGAPIAELWTPAVREEIAASFAASGSPAADPNASWTVTQLDRHAAQWAEARTGACVATLVDHLQTPESMELRHACLDRARNRLAVVIEVLMHADRSTVEHVESIVGELAELDRCGDVARLRAGAPLQPPAELAPAVEQARDALARAELLRTQGNRERALAAVEVVRDEAAQLGFEPLVVEIAVVEGNVLVDLDKNAEAEAVLRGAVTSATRLGMSDESIAALGGSVRALREQPKRGNEVEWLTTLALAIASRDDPGGRLEAAALTSRAIAVFRLGRPREAVELQRRSLDIATAIGTDERLIARHHGHLGTMLVHSGGFNEGVAELRHAIALHERLGTPPYFQLELRNALATALTHSGQHDESEALKRASFAETTAALGPRHAEVAAGATRIAGTLARRGELEASVGWYLAALAIDDVSGELPEFHSYLGFAQLLAMLGDLDAAAGFAERAHQLALARYGPDHPDTANVISMVAALAGLRGESERAQRLADAYVATAERVYGGEHVETARAWVGRADIRVQINGCDGQSEADYRRALSILERDMPSDHDEINFPRQNLADCLRVTGRPQQARLLLEQVWAARAEPDTSPTERGLTAQALAEVLWEQPSERARALALARLADASFAGVDTPEAAQLGATTRAWLVTHDEPAR